jgi:hypothetical protein
MDSATRRAVRSRLISSMLGRSYMETGVAKRGRWACGKLNADSALCGFLHWSVTISQFASHERQHSARTSLQLTYESIVRDESIERQFRLASTSTARVSSQTDSESVLDRVLRTLERVWRRFSAPLLTSFLRSYHSGSPAARSAAISASSRAVSLRNWVSTHEVTVNFGSARRSCVAQAFAFSGCPSSW